VSHLYVQQYKQRKKSLYQPQQKQRHSGTGNPDKERIQSNVMPEILVVNDQERIAEGNTDAKRCNESENPHNELDDAFIEDPRLNLITQEQVQKGPNQN